MSKFGDDSEMSEELRYLRSEFMKTIEYIKGRMLTFLYYSSLLQAGIFVYNNRYKDTYIDNIILAFTSLLVASLTMCFLIRYQRDYKYSLYRYDIFIDPEFSNKAKASLDVPYFEKETTELTLNKYFSFFKDESFMELYTIFNWGICFLTIISLIIPIIIHPEKLQEFYVLSLLTIFRVCIFAICLLILFFFITKIQWCIIRKETLDKLKKHQFYSNRLRYSTTKTSRTEIKKHMDKFRENLTPKQRLKQILYEEKVYKKLLSQLQKEKKKINGLA